MEEFRQAPTDYSLDGVADTPYARPQTYVERIWGCGIHQRQIPSLLVCTRTSLGPGGGTRSAIIVADEFFHSSSTPDCSKVLRRIAVPPPQQKFFPFSLSIVTNRGIPSRE